MKKLLLLTLLVAVATTSCDDTCTIDYYEKLINQEIDRESQYQHPKNANEYRPTNTDPKDFGFYDYVVIGGGSAGSVVASRLSEISNWKVLLLEAGKEENNFTDIPSMSAYTLGLEHNWGFNSTPQTTCCLAMHGVCPFPRGKSLGGTSAINALIYVRGNRLDYDKWADQGNPGWSYDDVLPYFIKSENSNIEGDDSYHGFDGHLSINYHTPVSKKVDIFLEANSELGVDTADYNGKEQLRVSRTQFTTLNGRRESSAKAFLGSASNRSNLHILTESYVTKVLISNSSKRAWGVLFSHKNTLYVVKVNKEVILSAGVVGSPHILMLSGVGPKNHLTQHKINIVHDLAVGQTLHDHLTFYNMYFYSSYSESSLELREGIKQYLNGTGPLTISTNPQGVGFYHLGLTNSTAPDLEIVFVPSINSRGFDGPSRGAYYGYMNELFETHRIESDLNNFIFQFVIVLLHPKTTGKVFLKSSSPYEYPSIDSSCLADPKGEDVENVYKGIQEVLKLMDTRAFKKLNATLLPYVPCGKHLFQSKDYWLCLIRQTATNAYHGTGTCRMGPDASKGAVVDSNLRVNGISHLRVADTSVIPVTLSAHMNAPAMMIGEKLADLIKQENNYTT